jgi:predicted nucleic acid-binding protein
LRPELDLDPDRSSAPPSPNAVAFRFPDALLERPACCLVRPGPGHWDIFRKLCETGNIGGKNIADAAHAALAIESGCEWVTADTDFARFAPALRWQRLQPSTSPAHSP